MRYYKVSPIGENAEPQEESVPSAVTERQAAIEALIQTQTFEVGQMIEAQVKQKLKGNKVTYLIGDLSFTEKEPRSFERIPESGEVKVEIKSLKEDGSINHVKFVQS
jgi:mannose/fructose/N-acetylgalactosamine-specific phosphotransferase system component IIB